MAQPHPIQRAVRAAGLGAWLALAVLVTGEGCAPQRVGQPYVMVNREGVPMRVGDEDSPAGWRERLDNQTFVTKELDAQLAKVDEHVTRAVAAHGTPRLMIYVHGGLSWYTDRLDYIADTVDAQGLLDDTDIYPIFLIWDSSFLSAFSDDVFEVRGGERKPFGEVPGTIFGFLTAPFVLAHRLTSSLAGAPMNLGNQLDQFSEGFIESEPIPSEEIDTAAKIGQGVVSGLAFPAGLASSSLFSGFGTGAWDMMKRRIDRMFVIQEHGKRKGQLWKGGARLFFEELGRRLDAVGRWKRPARPERPAADEPQKVELWLVGHSMGAIIVNKVLKAFPALRFDRIVYLGAASSVEDFRESVVPYLARHRDSRFYSFSLAHRNESQESAAFDTVPRGSLLVWIDHMLEPGLSPNGRRIGRWRNLQALKFDGTNDDDREVCSRLNFVKLPRAGDYPTRHGEFGEKRHLRRLLAMSDGPLTDCPCCMRYDPCTVGARAAFQLVGVCPSSAGGQR